MKRERKTTEVHLKILCNDRSFPCLLFVVSVLLTSRNDAACTVAQLECREETYAARLKPGSLEVQILEAQCNQQVKKIKINTPFYGKGASAQQTSPQLVLLYECMCSFCAKTFYTRS